MLKFALTLAAVAVMLSSAAVAQEQDQLQQQQGMDLVERVLIDDPEPVETEYFLAEGAANAEIVTEDDELHMEAVALAALSEGVEGDMASMSEAAEE